MAFVRCLLCCVQAFAGSYDALLGATAAALAAASTDVQASLEPIKAYSKAKQRKAKQSKAKQSKASNADWTAAAHGLAVWCSTLH